jgi:hypothetical protein
MEIVNLPGAYGLTANSPEELCRRHFILLVEPDALRFSDVLVPSSALAFLAVQLLFRRPQTELLSYQCPPLRRAVSGAPRDVNTPAMILFGPG